jgi:hypothetical protein
MFLGVFGRRICGCLGDGLIERREHGEGRRL